ncbi:hypothetical protein GW916_05225 [bacterium]|nr:hypothetical protein [bacterium]
MNMLYRFLTLNRTLKAKTPRNSFPESLCLPFILRSVFCTFLTTGVVVSSVLASTLFVADAAYAEDVQDKAGMKDRLNKIFYWHLADELKLSPKQEKDVIAKLNEIQSKREEALKTREEAISSLQGLAKDAPLSKTKPFLDKYIKCSETLAGLDKEEYNGLKEVLGEELLARFYIIREDVTSRVRKALKK